jgi:hypothetical protein
MSLVTAQTHLWTVHRAGKEASAYVRRFSFGRQLRVLVGGEAVFSRLLRDEDAEGVLALSGETLASFLRGGWTKVLDA